MPRRFLCWFLTMMLFAGAAVGQGAQAAKIRQQVGKIGVLGNVTVSIVNGPEYYGSISRIGADDFSINEVDQRREIVVRYSEVRRVREGYGTTRNIRGQLLRRRLLVLGSFAHILRNDGLRRLYRPHALARDRSHLLRLVESF